MSVNVASHQPDMTPEALEQHRHECEARYWLDVTSGDEEQIDEKMKAIAKKRGFKAADRLRAEIRRQGELQNKNHNNKGRA